ncbi:MAG: hypothetical protein ACI9UN_002366 [Granulosicoccus sp.]|jgi:hypothetical protein
MPVRKIAVDRHSNATNTWFVSIWASLDGTLMGSSELVANAVMLQMVADQTRVLQDLHNEGYSIDTADLAAPNFIYT